MLSLTSHPHPHSNLTLTLTHIIHILTLTWLGHSPLLSLIDPHSPSTRVLDTSFDPSSAAAQQHLINVCDTLINSQDLFRSLTHCWIYEFKEWLANNHPNVKFPVPPKTDRTDPHSFDTLLRKFGKQLASKGEHDHMLVWDKPISRDGPVDYDNKLLGCTIGALQTIEFMALTDERRRQYDSVQKMMDKVVW